MFPSSVCASQWQFYNRVCVDVSSSSSKSNNKRKDAASSTLKCYFHMYKARESAVVQCNQVDAQ